MKTKKFNFTTVLGYRIVCLKYFYKFLYFAHFFCSFTNLFFSYSLNYLKQGDGIYILTGHDSVKKINQITHIPKMQSPSKKKNLSKDMPK